MSQSLTGISLTPFKHWELTGLHFIFSSVQGQDDVTYVIPTLGLIVQNILLDISTSIIVAALKKLDLPVFVLPQIAISILSPCFMNCINDFK
jgi:hypothetical protein